MSTRIGGVVHREVSVEWWCIMSTGSVEWWCIMSISRLVEGRSLSISGMAGVLAWRVLSGSVVIVCGDVLFVCTPYG